MEVLSGLDEFRMIIRDGEYVIRDCKIDFLVVENAAILLIENSRIGSLSGNAVIHEVCNSWIYAIRDMTVLKKVCGNSELGHVHDHVIVHQLCDHSSIAMLQHDSRVEQICGDAKVTQVIDHAQVGIPTKKRGG